MIFSLENDDGKIQEGTDNIKSTIFNFYSQLYTKKTENEVFQDELLSKIETFLTPEEKMELDSPINENEIFRSYKNG